MKKDFLLISAVSGLLAWCGCTNIGTFDYAGASGSTVQLSGTVRQADSVAVLPFLDRRGVKSADPERAFEDGHPAGDHGSFYFGLIPLMPFGFVEKEEPENSQDFVSQGYFHFNPSSELADAAFVSLKRSGLFRRVTRAASPEQADTRYLWRGSCETICYRGYLLTYGITYFLSPALWVLGAPHGVSFNEIWLKFELIERSSGKVVWTYRTRESDYLVHWIYARIGQDTSLYAPLMKRAMNQALYNLGTGLASADPVKR